MTNPDSQKTFCTTFSSFFPRKVRTPSPKSSKCSSTKPCFWNAPTSLTPNPMSVPPLEKAMPMASSPEPSTLPSGHSVWTSLRFAATSSFIPRHWSGTRLRRDGGFDSTRIGAPRHLRRPFTVGRRRRYLRATCGRRRNHLRPVCAWIRRKRALPCFISLTRLWRTPPNSGRSSSYPR